jgi:hypothetical protein
MCQPTSLCQWQSYMCWVRLMTVHQPRRRHACHRHVPYLQAVGLTSLLLGTAMQYGAVVQVVILCAIVLTL